MVIMAPRAILRTDTVSRMRWLDFEHKPDEETRAQLKAAGWRWSGYRKQWYTTRKSATIPARITVEDGGTCDYAAERPERLSERAAKHEARATAAYERGHQIADRIPLGQPILVGHHSEAHARRDIARIDSAMRTTVEESKKAERLQYAAESSARHQQHLQSAGTIARRLYRLQAELRRMERNPWAESARDLYQRRLDALKSEIATAEEELAAASGSPADLEVHEGDIVRVKGFRARVDRVNPKTISATIISGGARGWSFRWDKSWIEDVETPTTDEQTPEATDQ